MVLLLKNLAFSTGDRRDVGLIPGSGRPAGGQHGSPLQCSCLENPTDRGAWRTTVHGVAQSWTWLKRLSTQHNIHKIYLLNHFSAFSKVVLSTRIFLCNYHYFPSSKLFLPCKTKALSLDSNYSFRLSLSVLLSVSMVLTTIYTSYKGSHTVFVFL